MHQQLRRDIKSAQVNSGSETGSICTVPFSRNHAQIYGVSAKYTELCDVLPQQEGRPYGGFPLKRGTGCTLSLTLLLPLNNTVFFACLYTGGENGRICFKQANPHLGSPEQLFFAYLKVIGP